MKTFTFETDVRWGDMDAIAHVSNVVYLRYMEEARARWLAEITGDWDWLNKDIGPVVANININYRRPVHWPQRLRLTLKPKPPGRTSMKLETHVHSADDESVLFADSMVTFVWVDRKTGEPVPVPQAIRDAAE